MASGPPRFHQVPKQFQPLMRLQASLLALALATPLLSFAAVKVTVSRDDTGTRPAQIVVVPYNEVLQHLPGLRLDQVAVFDAQGKAVDCQVTNFRPELRPAVYDEILFQTAFAEGQQSVTFTIDASPTPVPPAQPRVFARYVPERLDDFAFENDRVAARIYGPSLMKPEEAGKSTLVASGIDVWAKRVPYLIVDRWYSKGHDAYHVDTGEGVDLFAVGNGRGCGGSGIWADKRLWVSSNWSSWKVLANGPLRAIFELTYDTWDAHGTFVSERKRFTVDAGTNFHHVVSTYTFNGKAPITPALGLGWHTKDITNSELTVDPAKGYLSLWETYKKHGALGTAVILSPEAPRKGVEKDALNHLLLSEASSGVPLSYYVGAGWDRAGHFSSREAWDAEVAAFAARLAHPLKVHVSAD